jgi:hypothetical protein
MAAILLPLRPHSGQVGTPMPAFRLPAVDGSTVTRPILERWSSCVWATW